MRVLVISHMYPAFDGDYNGLFVHQQVQAFRRMGCEVKVVSPRPFIPWPLSMWGGRWARTAILPDSTSIRGVEVFFPRYLSFPRNCLFEFSGLSMFWSLIALGRRLRHLFRYDLIHAHTALPDGFAAMSLAKRFGIPFVVTVHGQDFQSSIHMSNRVRRTVAEVLRSSAKYVTVSRSLLAKGQSLGVTCKGCVIHNGLDHESIQGQCLQHGPWPVVVSVSNLTRTKGIDLNIRAIASLMYKYPSLKYHVVGDGEELSNLRALVAKLGLDRSVFFLGRMKHDEAMREIREARIFSMPSSPEGFGIVYLEAMAQAKPVIGCWGEGPEDFIEHGKDGLLIRPRDVHELTMSLDVLLRDVEFADRIRFAGRDKARSQFTWKKNAGQYLRLFDTVLSNKLEK